MNSNRSLFKKLFVIASCSSSSKNHLFLAKLSEARTFFAAKQSYIICI